MGKLIVIEGLDGSGKATQAALLARGLRKQGKLVRKISFPDYQQKSSILAQMYLAGEIGALEEVNPYAASTFYAADRYISFRTDWRGEYEKGHIIVADRYSTSNITHQTAKFPKEKWDAFLGWVEDYEYGKLELPRPDMVIYLDLDPALADSLLDKRYKEAGNKDIHEENTDYAAQSRAAALYAADKLGWRVVCCSGGSGAMRPAGEIAKEIKGLCDQYFSGGKESV